MSIARPPIEPLPAPTKSQLRSTQILTSLPQLVSELVQNSIDACARNIDVSVDPEEWECCVRDDGSGIPRDGLALLADGDEAAARYGTSKAYTPASLSEVATFGFRGEALASVADLCCLEMSSRTKHASESWSIILKGGQTLYAGPSVRWRRESQGTVVSVRDAFFNLPIRRKSHPNPARTLELIRKELETLALVFPQVCFSLENTNRAKGGLADRKARILTIPKARQAALFPRACVSLTLDQTSSSLITFRHLYGKALVQHADEVDESHDGMRLEGFISLEGAYSKAYQFLYVNKHPLETCDLHRAIDVMFSRSSYGKHACDESGFSTTLPATRRSPRKTEKRPVYVLNLTIHPKHVDNCIDPKKAAIQLQDSAAATTFLTTVVESFLVRHGFLHLRREAAQRSEGSPSPRKKRKVIHTGSLRDSLTTQSLARSTSQSVSTSRYRYLPRSQSAPSLPTLENLIVGDTTDAPDIIWTDPTTGETFIVDARTGNSYPQQAPTAPPARDTTAIPHDRTRRTLPARTPGDTAQAPAPAWITHALQSNEAYKLTERKVPVVSTCAGLSASVSSLECGQPRPPQKQSALSRPSISGSWETSQLSQFSREDLRRARVLGQVDRKFIACILRPSFPAPVPAPALDPGQEDDEHKEEGPGARGHTLVLIDQHAADERVRVERFLADLCEGFLACAGHATPNGVRARNVEPPVQLLLTRAEAMRLGGSQDVRRAFARWGITFADMDVHALRDEDGKEEKGEGEGEGAYVQVAVTGVPEVVADKLLSGNEVRELVKGFLAKLETDGVEGTLQARDDGGAQWQKALRWCPRELVELINSKACRGAIMFNDTLTLEQCKTLVANLSETALPFQCAHGRPSLVPLVDTGGAEAGRAGDSRGEIRWEEFMHHGRGGSGEEGGRT